MPGLALALGSSLCWGVSDFLGGLQSRRLALLRVMLVSQVVGLAGLGVVVAARGHGPPALHHLLAAIGGGLAGLIGLTGFYRGLAIGMMSIVAPIAATGVAVPVIVGVAGGERPAASQVIGIVAALMGIVLASREREAEPSPRERAPTRASVGMALIAALGFGLFFVGVRASARFDPIWAAFFARSASVAALLVAGAIAPSRLRDQGGGWWALALVGTLDVAANVLYALATRHGLLSVISVLSSLYPVITVLLARGVLGERVRRGQELGVLAALAGVLLIASG